MRHSFHRKSHVHTDTSHHFLPDDGRGRPGASPPRRPGFCASRRVSRGSGRAFLNELLTSHLGRRSTPTRPQLPDRLPRRWPSTSTRAPRRLVLGRHGSGAAVRERGGARRRARTCSEAVSNPHDWWRPMTRFTWTARQDCESAARDLSRLSYNTANGSQAG